MGENHPAFTRWESDAELLEKFGQHLVKVEPQQEERLTDHCSRLEDNEASPHYGKLVDGRGQLPLFPVRCPSNLKMGMNHGRVTSFASFLRTYRSRPEYVITQLPTGMHSFTQPLNLA